MPEAMDKNWFQIIVAINGFRASYGQWPTKIRLPQDVPDTLAEGGLLVQLQQKLSLQFDGSPFVTEDDQGRSYCVLKNGFVANPDMDARTWLGTGSGELPPSEPARQVVKEPVRQPAYTPPARPAAEARTQITEPRKKDQQAKPRQTIRPEPAGKPAPKPKESAKGKPKQKPKPEVKAKPKLLPTVIVSEIVLVVIAIGVTLLISVLSYDGHCISFDTPVICSMEDYMTQVVLLMPYGAWVIGIQYWWAVLALVILFPVIGLQLAGRRARKRAAKMAQGE